jgi:alkanesulfonate monooxygenase SsuD/methylene tetrahydromethanopterin reductase-like flavin-dependent oxidoreductase (luciferase family)
VLTNILDDVTIRVGVLLLPTDPWAETLATARRLEEWGYDHLWTYDHLMWRRYQERPWHSTFPWLAGLATQTSRIRLGTMVANPNIRHPLLLAKDCMTIDHLSEGRFTLGIGAGGTGFDATALGQGPLSTAERLARLEEFVKVADGLLRNELTDHEGDWYEVNDARMLPGCVQRPRLPIAIAAGGARGLRLVAESAEAWITYGDSSGADLSPAGTITAVRDQTQMLEAACEAIGRDPGEISRIYLIGNTSERPLRSVDAFDDFAGRYAELGFTDLVFHQPRPDDPVWNDPEEVVAAIASRRRPG